jgi:hypothetical protein
MMVRAGSVSLAVLALAAVAGTACGRLNRSSPDAGRDDAGTPPEQDASVDVEVDTGVGVVVVACDFDASPDAAPCVPPSDDTLVATPFHITAASGSYGVATFVAQGSWTNDPGFYMSFAGSSLPLVDTPIVMSYGTPQSIVFHLAQGLEGESGTITVTGHAGNIEVSAFADLIVTACVPLAESLACGAAMCGFQDDLCGGVESCGTCSPAAPYCYLGGCITSQPHLCPPNLGFDPDAGGACVRCGSGCVDIDSQCVCPLPPTPALPVTTDGGLPPSDAGGTTQCNPVEPFQADATHVACPINQRCDFIDTTQTRCTLPVGTGIQEVNCNSNADCAAGYDCVNGATATVWCERYCRLGAAFEDCGLTPGWPAGAFGCFPFRPAMYDGAQEIGVCDYSASL